jgi:O-succinylbenzoic acid--CoA ligase
MDAETVISAQFWEDGQCHFAGNMDSPAHLECGSGSVVFGTSGSTGLLKWAVLRKEALLVSARAVNEWLDVDSDSVWGLSLPLKHVGGFGVAARAYSAGCGLSEYQGKWDAARYVEWLAREHVTHASLVPTQVHDLLKAGLEGAPSLRAVVVGGGRLTEEAGQTARNAGWPVLASYGMTEACSQVATQPIAALGKPFAEIPMGLLPIWDARLTGEGLLKLRGDALFAGLLDSGGYHAREGEWFTTSDRVELSGRCLKPLGRADSMVKVLGELVDVEAVERRLAEIAGGRVSVEKLAVIEMPDDRREHVLVAVFEGGAVPVCIADYNRAVPGPERIARWCEVADFPRSEMGKLRKGELRAMVAKGQGPGDSDRVSET